MNQFVLQSVSQSVSTYTKHCRDTYSPIIWAGDLLRMGIIGRVALRGTLGAKLLYESICHSVSQSVSPHCRDTFSPIIRAGDLL